MKLFVIILLLTTQLLANEQIEPGNDSSESVIIDENIISEININVDTDNTAELTDSEKNEILFESRQEDSISNNELELDIDTEYKKESESTIVTEDIETQNSPYKIITFLIIGLFSISLLLNYLLLRWRSKYKNQLVTFPENLIDQFERLGKDFSIIKSGVRGEFERYTEPRAGSETSTFNISTLSELVFFRRADSKT